MEQHDCDESWTLFEIHAEWTQNCHCFCKTLSQQKHVVLQPTAPLQLKRFKFGKKMVIAASSPVLLNQKNNVAKSSDSLMHSILISSWIIRSLSEARAGLWSTGCQAVIDTDDSLTVQVNFFLELLLWVAVYTTVLPNFVFDIWSPKLPNIWHTVFV